MNSALDDQFEFPQRGRVCWLSVRPARREAVQVVDAVEARVGEGLVGDHYRARKGDREVTLIQAEHVGLLAALLGRDVAVDPTLLRRNIMVAGINLLGLQRRTFQIGTAILECTGLAVPCSRMEEALGPGGWNAMRGHGGITARVVRDGVIRLQDSVVCLAAGNLVQAEPVSSH